MPEHNLPDITLFLLESGADANCNIALSSDSSNSPAQISASWQHLKVLYYLIIFGARSNYHNVHLRSVEQYAKDNHLINYIVQKALSLRMLRNKMIKRILYEVLLHPAEYEHLCGDSGGESIGGECIDFEFSFPMIDDEDSRYFNIHSLASDHHHINQQIRSNIDKSRKLMKRKRNSLSSRGSSSSLRRKHSEDPHRVYLLRDIVHIIYSMISWDECA